MWQELKQILIERATSPPSRASPQQGESFVVPLKIHATGLAGRSADKMESEKDVFPGVKG